MPRFIRTTMTHNGNRNEVNVNEIQQIQDYGQGKGATIVLKDGTELEVNESGQSIRGYVKKASAGDSSED